MPGVNPDVFKNQRKEQGKNRKFQLRIGIDRATDLSVGSMGKS